MVTLGATCQRAVCFDKVIVVTLKLGSNLCVHFVTYSHADYITSHASHSVQTSVECRCRAARRGGSHPIAEGRRAQYALCCHRRISDPLHCPTRRELTNFEFCFRNSAGTGIKVFRVTCDRKTSDMKIRFEVPNKLEITFGRGTQCYVILCFTNR